MNLIKAEINRFFSRRFLIIMLVSLLAAFGLTVFTVVSASETPTDAQWSNADQQVAEQKQYLEGQYTACRRDLDDKQRCEDLNPARVEAEDFLWNTFNFKREIKGLIYFLAAFLCLFGFLVSASFIGSELHSGGMTNLLLWRPERMKVLGTKLGVALGGITVISALFSVLYVGTFYGIASSTGLVGYISPDAWSDIVQTCLRGVGLAVVASLIAFSVATIGRHTAAALGALMGYIVVWEGGFRLMLSVVNRQGGDANEELFASTYIAAWMSDVFQQYRGSWDPVTLWEGGIVLAGIGLVFGLLAFFNFKRRDLA